MELDELYTEIIIRYSKLNKHRFNLENPDAVMHGVNPSCGDDITLAVKLAGNTVAKIAINGTGCAISQASAAIMAELVEGKTVEDAKKLIEDFLGMIKKQELPEQSLDALGDAVAFENISNMPARVKCAVLGWHTLKNALDEIKL